MPGEASGKGQIDLRLNAPTATSEKPLSIGI